MNILLWAPSGAGEHYGGAGMNAYRMYSRGADKELSVHLAHGNPSQPGQAMYSGVDYIGNAVGSLFHRVKFNLQAKKWLSRNSKNHDVFHGLFGYGTTVNPAYWASLLGMPSFVKIASHNADLAGGFLARSSGELRRRIARLRALSGVVATSEEIYMECVGLGVDKSRIFRIPNGVDSGRFCPVADECEKSQIRKFLGLRDCFTVVFSGAIGSRKRPHLLISAVDEMIRRGRDVQLIMIGPVREKGYGRRFLASIKRGCAEGYLHWMGMVRDVETYLKASDVLCLTSVREGMPNAVIEAMSSGLPVVMTSISGATDLVGRNECGIICGDSVEEVAAALEGYFASRRLQEEHGCSAREKVLASFDSKVVLAMYMEMFRGVKRSS